MYNTAACPSLPFPSKSLRIRCFMHYDRASPNYIESEVCHFRSARQSPMPSSSHQCRAYVDAIPNCTKFRRKRALEVLSRVRSSGLKKRERTSTRARARAITRNNRGIVRHRAARSRDRGDVPATRSIRRPIRKRPVPQCPVEPARERGVDRPIPNGSITRVRQNHDSMQHHHLRNRLHELRHKLVPNLQHRDREGVVVVVCQYHTPTSAQSPRADDNVG